MARDKREIAWRAWQRTGNENTGKVRVMDRRERFLARLAELAREREEPLRGWELVKSRLLWEDWETLREQTVAIAAKEIGCRKWRGSWKGVLPGGVDAEDVADQVIAEVLSGKARIAIGWTRARLMDEISRLVSQKVRVLQGRKETATVRNGSEIEAVDEEGGPASVFELVQDPGADACEQVAEREGEAGRRKLEREFEEWLGDEELRRVFRCLCAGTTKSKDIGRVLGVGEREVARLRRALKGRVAAFGRERRREGLNHG